MNIAIAHNFAENPGGGDLVALDIVEVLLEKKLNVTLYTSLPNGIRKAIEYFNKDPKTFRNLEIKRVKVPKGIRHPYNIHLITRRARDILKGHDLVIFFDDVPKPAEEFRKVLVYVHYTHAARIILNQLVQYRYKNTLKGKLLWRLHSQLFKTCFLMNWNKLNIYVAANSTLTHEHVVKALKPQHVAKIYPPVQVRQIIECMRRHQVEKEGLLTYIGRIQPEKGIEDIIKALRQLRNRDIKAKIVGFNYDNKYLQHLMRMVKELNLQNKVEISTNASRKEILKTLAKAKAIIHPARYEPFGIAVIEGMAAACIPIVRKGFNGPWIDIVEGGKYGYGYSTLYELTKVISSTIADESIHIDPYLLEKRSLQYSEEKFKERILQLLKRLT